MGAGPLCHLGEQSNHENPSGLAEAAEGQQQRQPALATEEGVRGSFSLCHRIIRSLNTARTCDLGHVPPKEALK